MRIGILGGGLTALTIGANLKIPYEILEKEPSPGGLCRSLKEDGFVFDFGGAHAIFSNDKNTLNRMLEVMKDNRLTQRRNAKVLYKGRYVKYPFENGLSDLPLNDNYECLISYIRNSYPAPYDFKSWIYHTFGRGIAEKYLIPYNEKIWNTPCDEMSMSWVEGRIPKPPLEDVVKSSLGIATEGYTHQLNFYYPGKGGIEGYIDALKKGVYNVAVNFDIDKITHQNKRWVVHGSGQTKEFDKLVSTIPVFDLAGAMRDVPGEIKAALDKLRYNSLVVVMLGYECRNISDISWLYVPDTEIEFHKISFPGNYSPENVPSRCSSIMTEATCGFKDEMWERSDEEMIRQTTGDLDRLGITKGKKRIFGRVMRSKYAYVINTHDYQSNLDKVIAYFTSMGISICGRFAEFKYLNMDACTKNALEMAGYLNTAHIKERVA